MSASPAPDRPGDDGFAGLSCWVVSDGRAGIEIQCRGLAETLGLAHGVKRVRGEWPWRWLPPRFWWRALERIDANEPLTARWPDLVIGTGRMAVAVNRAIKRASGGRSFVVQIQDPRIDPVTFDMIVVPRHDRLEGPNVFKTQGSLHGLTEAKLAAAAAEHEALVAELPRPRVTVLVGGNSRVHRMGEALARRLGARLAALCRDGGASLLVAPSRRTGAANTRILRDALAGLPAHVWDGGGANPYQAYLGLADAFIVTEDSVNMLCEAAFTGKPVHTFPVDGGTAKFKTFHANMRAAGIARPFTGALEHWTYPPLRETKTVAAEVRRRFLARGGTDIRSGSIDLSRHRG